MDAESQIFKSETTASRHGGAKWVRAVEYAVVLSLLAFVYFRPLADPRACACPAPGGRPIRTNVIASTGGVRFEGPFRSMASSPLPASAGSADVIAQLNALQGEVAALLMDMEGAQAGVVKATTAVEALRDALAPRLASLEAAPSPSTQTPRGLARERRAALNTTTAPTNSGTTTASSTDSTSTASTAPTNSTTTTASSTDSSTTTASPTNSTTTTASSTDSSTSTASPTNSTTTTASSTDSSTSTASPTTSTTSSTTTAAPTTSTTTSTTTSSTTAAPTTSNAITAASTDASVLKLKGIVESLIRISIINQLQREQRVRYEGGSGLTHVRSVKGGSRAYYEPAYSNVGFANMHNHPDNRDTLGMGELAAVLNGVEFWTRHNDYMLAEPHPNSTEYHATQRIEQPQVPPAVLAKAHGCGDGLCIADQAEEMRRWFHAWQDQDPACPSCQALDAARVARGEAAFDAPDTLRNYTPYFKPVLCYLEGGWINAQEGLEEPFKSERHHIEAQTWRELYDKNRFLYQSGRKNTLENLPFLPQIVRGTRNNGSEPIIANWEYRILCSPVKQDIKLNRFKVASDLLVQMLGSGQGPMTARELRLNRRARFDFNLRDQDRFHEGHQGYAFIDQLMEQIPGKDNHAGAPALRDTAFGDKAFHYARPNEELQAGYYSRFYRVKGPDAMGRGLHRRSFNDPNMWAAMTTQPKVSGIGACSSDILGGDTDDTTCKSTSDEFEQKWTWAVPLEVIYTTPLNSWNPYDIEICDDCNPVRNPGGPRRTGGFTQATAWSSARSTMFYYFTPVEFFTPSTNIDKDPADTDRGAVGVLDRHGVVRKVRASGHWIFFPRVDGFKDPIRQRYPIMPVHEHGKTSWKEIKALQDIVLKTYGTNSNPLQLNNARDVDEEFSGVSLRLAFTAGRGGIGGHDHIITLTGSDIIELNENGQVSASTSQANGHTHDVVVTRTKVLNTNRISRDVFKMLQCDSKLRQPDGSYNVRKCAGPVNQESYQANLTATIQQLQPWGYYSSPDTDLVDFGNLTGAWRDASGNGRDCSITYTSTEGPPVALSVPPERSALRVARHHKFRFPAGSIPTQFTIIVRARFIRGGKMQGIFSALEEPFWYLGWHQGKVSPTSFDELMVPHTQAVHPATGWYTFAGRNSATGTTVWRNGISISQRSGGRGGLTLSISVLRPSDAEISDVIIFDRHLPDANVTAISAGLVEMPLVPAPCCWDGHQGVYVDTA